MLRRMRRGALHATKGREGTEASGARWYGGGVEGMCVCESLLKGIQLLGRQTRRYLAAARITRLLLGAARAAAAAACAGGLPTSQAAAAAQRPERPQTTRDREKENITAVAAQPSCTMRGSPCKEARRGGGKPVSRRRRSTVCASSQGLLLCQLQRATRVQRAAVPRQRNDVRRSTTTGSCPPQFEPSARRCTANALAPWSAPTSATINASCAAWAAGAMARAAADSAATAAACAKRATRFVEGTAEASARQPAWHIGAAARCCTLTSERRSSARGGRGGGRPWLGIGLW